MKRLLLIPIAIFTLAIAQGQTSNWLWAKTAGGNFSDGGNSVCTDNKGNVFVAGYFKSYTITFGSDTLSNLNTVGGNDMFLAKYDSTGNVLWARSAGGSSEDIAYSVCTDSSGNALVTGTFSSPSITFGSYTLSNGSSHGDLFIVKYDPTGNVIWAKCANGNGTTGNGIYASDVSTDISGNVFVTGGFTSSTLTFDTVTLSNNASPGFSNIFLARYNAAGNLLWAKGLGGSGGAYGGDANAEGIVTDSSGNVFITGGFRCHNIVFGSDTLTNADTVNSASDIFYVKFDPSGNALWAKRQGGTGFEEGNSINIDADGNLFITGYFNSYSSFLGKYNSTGNMLWAKNTAGLFKNTSTDNNGNVFAVGYFYNTIVFGPDTLTNNGFKDPFLVKYDSTGNVYWAKTVAEYGSGFNLANDVSTNQSGDAFITGSFTSDFIVFDTTFNNVGLSACPGGCGDVFIARFCHSNAFITGNTTLCAGQSTTLTVTTPGTNYLWSTGDTTASITVNPAATATYSVTASLGNFTATATSIVTVNANPPPTAAFTHFINGYNVTLADASISYTGDSITGWDWEFPGAGPVSSSNSQDPVPIYFYPSGTYTVCLTVTSSMGCADKICDTLNIYVAPLNEPKVLTSISISPNPFSAFTTLHSDTPLLNATATLYNYIGQAVAQIKNINGLFLVLSRDNLPAGLYFIRMAQDNKTITENKLMIADN